MNKVKTTAILLGLTMGLTGNVFAAPAADASLDDRIAALEAQQKQLSEQIAELKKENSNLKKTSAIAKSNRTAITNLRQDASRFQYKGFGRVAWDNDNSKAYVDQNDFRRFYVDLEGKYRVNDKWSMNFQWETLKRYAKYHTGDGTTYYHDSKNGHDDESRGIQRIWAEGDVGKVHLDVGRRWRGMGYNFIYFGNESDGVVASTPIPGSNLTAEAFYLAPTDRGYHFDFYGAGFKGKVGHGLEMRAAYGKLNIGKHEVMGKNYYDPKHQDRADPATGNIIYNNEWNDYPNTAGTNAMLIGAMWNPMKNIFFLGDYVRTNRASNDAPDDSTIVHYGKKDTWAIQLNYRWPDLNSPGSFQLYSRWFDQPHNENGLVGVFGDKQDSFYRSGSKGWAFGFKYVPARNIEWDTAYQFAKAFNGIYGEKNETYHHNVLRTRVDFHF